MKIQSSFFLFKQAEGAPLVVSAYFLQEIAILFNGVIFVLHYKLL